MYRLLQLASLALAAAGAALPEAVTIKPDHPLIHFNGRWDSGVGTWWGSSGFKLNVLDLQHLELNLGPHTTSGNVSIGLSVDYASEFVNLNVTEGTNVLSLPPRRAGGVSVVRINVQGWQNNRMQLESIVLNADAVLLPYTPQRLAFQFIGDSLTAGQFLDNGTDGSWAFLASEAFRAEHNINAQPGACLTDQLCWGNEHGMSFQFFETEDTGYFYTTDHNFTTPWSFARDVTPTHVFVHIGANDASTTYNISQPDFEATYAAFLARLRKIYTHQQIFVLTPWGWPNADGTVGYYYQGAYQAVVAQRTSLGDNNIHLIDTTGWVTWADVFPDNQHPNPQGHAKIAALLSAQLEEFGVRPLESWATPGFANL